MLFEKIRILCSPHEYHQNTRIITNATTNLFKGFFHLHFIRYRTAGVRTPKISMLYINIIIVPTHVPTSRRHRYSICFLFLLLHIVLLHAYPQSYDWTKPFRLATNCIMRDFKRTCVIIRTRCVQWRLIDQDCNRLLLLLLSICLG